MSVRQLLFSFALLFLFQNPALATTEPATPDVGNPAVSPDSTKIVFSSDVGGKHTLYIANRDGKNAKPLFDATSVDPAWSIDGTKIIFASNKDADDFNIWTIGADGTNPQRLTQDPGHDMNPSYAPDGKQILFTSNRTGKREIWSMEQDGTGQHALGLQHLIVNDPSWSPDGMSVVYSGCTRPPNGGALADAVCNLYIVPVDDKLTPQTTMGTAFSLTTGKAQDWTPHWGPNGIVFSSSRGGGQSIWVVEPSGKNLKQITSDGFTLDPVWDKDTIVFSKTAHYQNIWQTDLSGHETQLTFYEDFE